MINVQSRSNNYPMIFGFTFSQKRRILKDSYHLEFQNHFADELELSKLKGVNIKHIFASLFCKSKTEHF